MGDWIAWLDHADYRDPRRLASAGQGRVANILRDPVHGKRETHVMILLPNGQITFIPPAALDVSADLDGQARMAI